MYDFIVVGGDTAGCLVAKNLAMNRSGPQVLLLESGGNNQDASTRVPGKRFKTFLNPGMDKGYESIPQPQLGGCRVACLRGNGLSGSLAIKFITYTHGAKDNYDEWARQIHDNFWAWERCKARFAQLEGLQEPNQKYGGFFQSNPDGGLGTKRKCYFRSQINTCWPQPIHIRTNPATTINVG
jgi:choline dehydrogenase